MKGIKAYQTTSVETAVDAAEPYKLTAMLFDALVKNIYLAKVSHQNEDWVRKSDVVTKAEAIAVMLASTLNDEAAPELSSNLRLMYDYIVNSLTEFMVTGDLELVDSSLKVARELKAGWDEIG